MDIKILLFIPAYNCEKQICRVLSQLDNLIIKYITEIIVVNNRSTDDTEKVVIKFMERYHTRRMKLLRNEENFGLGGSHKVAFQYAIENKFDYIVVLHGDDQGDIHDLLPVLERKEYLKYDCCLGARFMKGSKLEGYSKFRTFGNQVYNLLFSIVIKRKVRDLGSGINMYSTLMLKSRFYIKFPDKLTFNYCMIMAVDYYKQSVSFFPISWREEDQVSNVKMLSQATNVLKMLGSYNLQKGGFMQSELRERVVDNYTAQIICESVINNAE